MVCIVDYGMGNIRSVLLAFEKAGADPIVSNDPEIIASSQAIVLPGVGAFGDAMRNLKALGLVDVLKECVTVKEKPFLGICLGMQLLASVGYEHGEHEGLGIIEGEVTRLDGGNGLRIPHVGWNDVKVDSTRVPYDGFSDQPNFYFVHSFRLVPKSPDVVTGTCDYGSEFVVSVAQKNIVAVQFHPEKSQKTGLKVLENFLAFSKQPACSSTC
ncbi:MAG: imidazole glycerol phosphate synthase subunit HisH [Candidatus Melainabacteria bacterium]|nr:imidazole glycerol phosphate synthase subunit HisH [Candidatus Melainabacteria bacterium]